MASCGGLSPRQHQDSSQPANPGYLTTVSEAQDLTLHSIFSHEQAVEAYSASIIRFGENVRFINNILLGYFSPLAFYLFVSIKP